MFLAKSVYKSSLLPLRLPCLSLQIQSVFCQPLPHFSLFPLFSRHCSIFIFCLLTQFHFLYSSLCRTYLPFLSRHFTAVVAVLKLQLYSALLSVELHMLPKTISCPCNCEVFVFGRTRLSRKWPILPKCQRAFWLLHPVVRIFVWCIWSDIAYAFVLVYNLYLIR